MKSYFTLFFIFFSFLGFSQDEEIYADTVRTEVATDESSDSGYVYNKDDYERIYIFHSDILVEKNSDIIVTETIKVNAKGYDIERGIFRSLPMVRNINGGKENISYKILSIKRNGINEPYHTKKNNGIFTIYIGDKDKELDVGVHTYEIKYRTSYQIGYFDRFDELYWNVNGTDWKFPVDIISAKITLPTGARIIQHSCYTGEEGSNDQDCQDKALASNIIEFYANNLGSYQNLTVAVGFNKGVVTEPSGFVKFLKKNWVGFPLLFAVIYLLFFYFKNWKNYGKDPEKPTVYPLFNPPYDFSVASLGYINDKGFNNSLVTASLINLSIKGFITLKEEDKKGSKQYTITRTNKENKGLPEEESRLLKDLFDGCDTVVFDGKYDSKISSAVRNFQSKIEKLNNKLIEVNNNRKLVLKAMIIIAIVFVVVLLLSSIFTNSYVYLITGVSLLIVDGLLILLVVISIEDGAPKGVIVAELFFTISLFVVIFKIAFFPTSDIPVLTSHSFKFLIFGIISILIFRYLIKQPNSENVKLQSMIDGFKMYLGTAEEHVIKFHNPPEMTKTVFEKYLPYAIVFGVQDIWGKRFKDVLGDSLDNPEFDSKYSEGFSQSFSLSMSNAISDTIEKTYTPSSSSGGSSSSSSYSGGSSSSGSSGGSSGGGGGGGGGGGW